MKNINYLFIFIFFAAFNISAMERSQSQVSEFVRDVDAQESNNNTNAAKVNKKDNALDSILQFGKDHTFLRGLLVYGTILAVIGKILYDHNDFFHTKVNHVLAKIRKFNEKKDNAPNTKSA